MTFGKAKLSGSTDGRMIKVGQTVTPGTMIHTVGAISGADNFDEIWLWAQNLDTVQRKLTIEWGGVTVPDDTLEVLLMPGAGLVQIIPGWILQNALVVRAFVFGAADLIMIGGYVNTVRA